MAHAHAHTHAHSQNTISLGWCSEDGGGEGCLTHHSIIAPKCFICVRSVENKG